MEQVLGLGPELWRIIGPAFVPVKVKCKTFYTASYKGPSSGSPRVNTPLSYSMIRRQVKYKFNEYLKTI